MMETEREKLEMLFEFGKMLNASIDKGGSYWSEQNAVVKEISKSLLAESITKQTEKPKVSSEFYRFIKTLKKNVGEGFEFRDQSNYYNAMHNHETKQVIEYRRGTGATTAIIALMEMYSDVYYVLSKSQIDYLQHKLSKDIIDRLVYDCDLRRGKIISGVVFIDSSFQNDFSVLYSQNYSVIKLQSIEK